MRVKEWLIHKLGGYTSKEVFAKAWQVAQTIHVRSIQAKPGTDDPVEYDEEDEDMRDKDGGQDDDRA